MKKLVLIFSSLFCIALSSHGQSQFNNAQTQAKAYRDDRAYGIRHDRARNIDIDTEGVIHLFMFEDGNLLLGGYPTTAIDKDKFQVHLFTTGTNEDTYVFEAVGSYEQTLNTEGSNKEKLATDKATRNPDKLERLDFAVVGPFTSQVVFTVKRSKGGAAPNPISSATVKIGKTIHASVGTGFVYSTLKNPTTIHGVPITTPGGDSTLIADNANGNATLSLMATLYPWGSRNNLMMPNGSIFNKTGIVVGTTIASSAKNFKNLYLGLQFDFAIGGSIVAGADIAERQKIYGVNYSDFTFGETKYSGKVANKLYKEVGVGFFVGVQVDSRIFSKMFAQ